LCVFEARATKLELRCSAVTRHEFLREIHKRYAPRSYLEIGVNKGESLALSRSPTIAIDPAYAITAEVSCDLALVRATSDDFFAANERLSRFPDGCVDLAFVDGLHLFEFALRDFMNVECRSRWTSVVVFDDVLPRNVREASRERGGMLAWTGDVFKMWDVLRRYRPELLMIPVDVKPTGVLVVLGADPASRVLAERYNDIVAENVYPDPQRVPEAVLRREGAVDPRSFLDSQVWALLSEARERGTTREEGWAGLRHAAESAGRRVPPRELIPAQLRPSEFASSRAAGERPPARQTRRGRALRTARRHLRALRRRH
jgi:hypothetical protein